MTPQHPLRRLRLDLLFYLFLQSVVILALALHSWLLVREFREWRERSRLAFAILKELHCEQQWQLEILWTEAAQGAADSDAAPFGAQASDWFPGLQ
jgi:hypothetical protein